MPKKARKSTPNDSPQRAKKVSRPPQPATPWLSPILFSFAAGAGYYFISPILAYADQQDTTMKMMLVFLCAALGFLGELEFFRKHIRTIAWCVLPVTILQSLVSLGLSYKWLASNSLLLFFARDISIPLAVIWFFILRHGASPLIQQITPNQYYIKEVFYSTASKVAAGIVLMIAGILFFFRLGYFDIWEDENLVINAAIGVTREGLAYFKEGYDRAALHTLICAGVFEVFGVSEFTARIPSAIFGLVFIAGSIYVFSRWYGVAWIAILIPLTCLMNDRFLILFRYMRMYALLIPLFLLGVYLIHRTLSAWQAVQTSCDSAIKRKDIWVLLAAPVLCLPLLAHIHKLSMVLLPVFALYILYQTVQQPTRRQWIFLGICAGAGILLLILTFVVEIGPLKMFRQAAGRIFLSHAPKPAYYQFMFDNGLSQNSTIMMLLAGMGLLVSRISRAFKSLLVLQYVLVLIPFLFMVYLAGDEGKDYRYIAHIVPFVVSILFISGYAIGQMVWPRASMWVPVGIFLLSVPQLMVDADRVYVKHPWAPSYAQVYTTLKSNFKPGDALFAQNIKTYYLDPVALAGVHYHKVPKRRAYTMEQFLADIHAEQSGWFMWELHKAQQWRPEILDYIYSHFKPYHNQDLDDLGVELFYFDASMIDQ